VTYFLFTNKFTKQIKGGQKWTISMSINKDVKNYEHKEKMFKDENYKFF
jgi:hypothetical protein